MSFTDALVALNGRKQRQIIKDYAGVGAVAATTYMEPVFTEDLNVIILVENDEEYQQHIPGDCPGSRIPRRDAPSVGWYPRTVISFDNRDAVEGARLVRAGNISVKIASAEHLILLYLQSALSLP